MSDIGFTHIALPATNVEASVAFYKKYARMEVVHQRSDAGVRVAWISDRTRPFVIVLIQVPMVDKPLGGPAAHLGVGCASRDEVDRLCAQAKAEGCLVSSPTDWGPPVGYWALLRDPDGHTLELAHGQEVGLTVESSAGELSKR